MASAGRDSSSTPGSGGRGRAGRCWSPPRPRSGRRRPRPRPAARAGRREASTVAASSDPAVSRSTAWAHAPARPSSSRAGGRSPSTRRRTSTTVRRISSPRSCSWRDAPSAPGGSRARAVSVFSVSPASAGPMPSCRSRRSRRRSSSRARTSRSRARCRSSRSSRACSAPPSCRARSRTSRSSATLRRTIGPVGQVTDGDPVGQQRDGGSGAAGAVRCCRASQGRGVRGRGAGHHGAVGALDADVAQVQPGGELGQDRVQEPVDVGCGF